MLPVDAALGHAAVQYREPLLALAAANDLADARCENAHRRDRVARVVHPHQTGCIARTSYSGLTGVSFTSTPNGARASQTALAMAAGGATAPPSPTPLTPRGLSGEGECWCTMRIAGISLA